MSYPGEREHSQRHLLVPARDPRHHGDGLGICLPRKHNRGQLITLTVITEMERQAGRDFPHQPPGHPTSLRCQGRPPRYLTCSREAGGPVTTGTRTLSGSAPLSGGARRAAVRGVARDASPSASVHPRLLPDPCGQEAARVLPTPTNSPRAGSGFTAAWSPPRLTARGRRR